MAKMALIGRMNIIPTNMMGKMEMELPAMYMTNTFISPCLKGATAVFHDFYFEGNQSKMQLNLFISQSGPRQLTLNNSFWFSIFLTASPVSCDVPE